MSSQSSNDIIEAKMNNRLKNIQKEKRNYWKQEEEIILKDWADKAQCYEWMHLKAHEKYKSRKTWFTIPVIVISTITGTANFAQERFGKDLVQYVVMVIGTLNLIAAIITTIYQFLKISELNESYRMSALSWGKYYRSIKTELLKHPLDRKNHDIIFKYASEEYDRLIELSPLIPKHIILQFNAKFKNDITFTKPEICNNNFGTDIFTMTNDERKDMIEELFEDDRKKRQALLDELNIIKKNNEELKLIKVETEDELNSKLGIIENKLELKQQELEKVTKQLLDTIDINNNLSRATSENEITDIQLTKCVDNEENDSKVVEFRETFLQLHGRYPEDDEIKDTMKLFNNNRRKTIKGMSYVNIDFNENVNVNDDENDNEYDNDNENEDTKSNTDSFSNV